MIDKSQLTTADKSPSRWESESQVDARFRHPGGSGLEPSTAEPSEYPKTLHGAVPKDEQGYATGPAPVMDVANAGDQAAAEAAGFKASPADHLEVDPRKPIAADGEQAAEDAALAKTIGPTLEAYEAAGYAPETYPPTGFAEVDSPGLRAYREAEAEKATKAAWPGIAAKTALVFLALLSLFAVPLAAQTTVTQTTLSAALSAPGQGAPNTIVTLASATGVQLPSATQVGSELFVDQEAMVVQSLVAGTTTSYNVIRGFDGTNAGQTGAGIQHASGALVYVGPAAGVFGSPFVISDPPLGNCTLTNEVYSIRVNTRNGRVWQCTGSTTAAVWMNSVDSYAWIGPGNCWYSVVTGTVTAPTFGAVSSGTALGITTQISTVPAIPVIQVSSTNAAVISTDTITCGVPIPSRINASKGAYVVDATFAYGIIGAGGVNATQVAVEASGTMNGGLVFSQVAFPVSGAAETASTVAPVRWDAGTLVLTPIKTAFNSLVTTAGAFFTQKFTPATPIPMTSDLTQYFVSLPVLCNTTQATTIYSSGVLIHYRQLTGL